MAVKLVPAVPTVAPRLALAAQPMAYAVARFYLAARPCRAPPVAAEWAPAGQIAGGRPALVLPVAVRFAVGFVVHFVRVVRAFRAAQATVTSLLVPKATLEVMAPVWALRPVSLARRMIESAAPLLHVVRAVHFAAASALRVPAVRIAGQRPGHVRSPVTPARCDRRKCRARR